MYYVSCVPMVASGKAERSGAENEPRDFFSYFLWRRERSKETSTLTKASPVYGEDATQEIAETDDFLPFWYRGTRDGVFIGWRIEKTLNLIIYTIELTPRGMGCETPN